MSKLDETSIRYISKYRDELTHAKRNIRQLKWFYGMLSLISLSLPVWVEISEWLAICISGLSVGLVYVTWLKQRYLCSLRAAIPDVSDLQPNGTNVDTIRCFELILSALRNVRRT
jgi:hypothetical protein